MQGDLDHEVVGDFLGQDVRQLVRTHAASASMLMGSSMSATLPGETWPIKWSSSMEQFWPIKWSSSMEQLPPSRKPTISSSLVLSGNSGFQRR